MLTTFVWFARGGFEFKVPSPGCLCASTLHGGKGGGMHHIEKSVRMFSPATVCVHNVLVISVVSLCCVFHMLLTLVLFGVMYDMFHARLIFVLL